MLGSMGKVRGGDEPLGEPLQHTQPGPGCLPGGPWWPGVVKARGIGVYGHIMGTSRCKNLQNPPNPARSPRPSDL